MVSLLRHLQFNYYLIGSSETKTTLVNYSTNSTGGGGGGGGAALIYLPSRLLLLQSFLLFFTQNKGGGAAPRAPPLDPPLNKESSIYWSRDHVSQQTIYYQFYFPLLSFVFPMEEKMR